MQIERYRLESRSRQGNYKNHSDVELIRQRYMEASLRGGFLLTTE